jgi:ribokinase
MPARVVVVGSANTDLVVRVAKLPRPGETVLGGTFASVGGGKGANQAVAAARAGGDVAFIAMLGEDDIGDAALAAYKAEGIDTKYIGRASGCPSGVALILVDAAGENSIAVASGANDRLSPADIDAARDVIAAADTVLVQLEIPLDTVRRTVEVAVAAGRRVILNPAPARPLDPSLLAQVSVITPNETEAELLTGVAIVDPAAAVVVAERLRSLGPDAVLTLGRRGCLVASGGEPVLIAGYDVEAIDTVAAGDVFNGTLAVALAEGSDVTAAARFANAAAAISVTRHGAQSSAPLRHEIDSSLQSAGGARARVPSVG